MIIVCYPLLKPLTKLRSSLPVLVKDDASLLAMELGFNPIIDEEAAFDILPK
jgi:hypothetical protein